MLASSASCSILQRVSHAQNAGAVAVLLASSEHSVLAHPSVPENWMAYNISIMTGVVSAATYQQLRALQEHDASTRIDLSPHNEIAEAWDQIRPLSKRVGWPMHKQRKEQMLQRVLASGSLDDAQLDALKHEFLTVAGGNVATWNRLLGSDQSDAATSAAHQEL